MVYISTIVCTSGRKTLANCLKSLREQTHPDYETIVVAYNRVVEKIIPRGQVRFFLSPKASTSAQRNIGIAHATGEIVAFIDDDGVADANWLTHLAKHYKSREVVGVGGKIVPHFLAEVPTFLRELPPGIVRGFLGQTILDSKQAFIIDKPLLWACNLSFRKSIFDEIGGFDEKLGRSPDNLMGEEEIELQKRILDRGYKLVYEPKALVTHLIDKERLTKGYFLERSFWQGYSEIMSIRHATNFERLWQTGGVHFRLFKCAHVLKFVELLCELVGNVTFRQDVDTAKRLGRIAAFWSLLVER
jgi:GT2 family glycosyltransferase